MRPRLFAEIPAGLAAVSLRLHGGPRCRPPISRMGNKQGYGEAILGALGLDSGSGAGAYLWVEADPDVRALLCAYPDGAMLQRIAAIIRGWADEEPRALWERLRAERKERGPREDAEAAASFVFVQGRTKGGAVEGGFKDTRPNMDARRADRGLDEATLQSIAAAVMAGREARGMSKRQVDDALGVNTACAWWEGRNYLGEFKIQPPAPEMWPRICALLGIERPDLDAALAAKPSNWEKAEPGCDEFSDACDRLAAHTAGTALLHRWSFSEKGPDHGYGGPGCRVNPSGEVAHGWTTENRDAALGCGVTADRFEAMAREVAGFATGHALTGMSGGYDSASERAARGERWGGAVTDFVPRRINEIVSGWPPVIVAPRVPRAADVADLLGTPGDLDGVVVYADPPYAGTTGYRDNLTRAEVVAYAADFAALGAVVCVSEAVAIPELVAMGWHSAEITEGRKGQKRTFAATRTEWITMNREPAHRVAVQGSLWGAA